MKWLLSNHLDRRSFLAGTLLTIGGSVPTIETIPGESRHILEIVATEQKELYYEFAVRGSVRGIQTSDTIQGGTGNDALVTGIDPDVKVVRGFTGNPGHGDAYRIDGEIFHFARTGGESDFYIRLDGERTSVSELNNGPDPTDPLPPVDIHHPIDGTFEIVTTEEAELYYEFAVRGSVRGIQTSDTIQGGTGNDALVTGIDPDVKVVRGFTGNPGHGDAYRIDGTLLSFQRSGGSSDFFVRVEGTRYDDIRDLPPGGREATLYHSAVTVSAPEYDRVRLSMSDGTTIEFTDQYTGETTFGYAGDYAVTDGDVTFDEFHGALEDVSVGNNGRELPVNDSPAVSGVIPYLQDVEFKRSTVDLTTSTLGSKLLRVEFTDGTIKSYHYDMGDTEGFGSPGRIVEAVDYSVSSNIPDFGVRVPNPDPADVPDSEPAITFTCTSVTIEKREFINTYLPSPGTNSFELCGVTLTFADGSEQEFSIEDPSFPVTLRGRGAHAGKIITEFHKDMTCIRREIRVPNPRVTACN